MGIIIAIVVGLLVGIVAKFLMPGPDGGGFIITSILGVGGALVAHSLGSMFGYYGANEPVGFIAAVVGAMILLGIYRMFIGGRQLPR